MLQDGQTWLSMQPQPLCSSPTQPGGTLDRFALAARFGMLGLILRTRLYVA